MARRLEREIKMLNGKSGTFSLALRGHVTMTHETPDHVTVTDLLQNIVKQKSYFEGDEYHGAG